MGLHTCCRYCTSTTRSHTSASRLRALALTSGVTMHTMSAAVLLSRRECAATRAPGMYLSPFITRSTQAFGGRCCGDSPLPSSRCLALSDEPARSDLGIAGGCTGVGTDCDGPAAT